MSGRAGPKKGAGLKATSLNIKLDNGIDTLDALIKHGIT